MPVEAGGGDHSPTQVAVAYAAVVRSLDRLGLVESYESGISYEGAETLPHRLPISVFRHMREVEVYAGLAVLATPELQAFIENGYRTATEIDADVERKRLSRHELISRWAAIAAIGVAAILQTIAILVTQDVDVIGQAGALPVTVTHPLIHDTVMVTDTVLVRDTVTLPRIDSTTAGSR